MDLGLKGLRVVVTGATKGIGRAIAQTFAQEGARVAVCARNAAAVHETVAVLERSGVEAQGGAVDVADHAGLKRWVGEVAQRWGGLDIVVANVSALAIGNDEASWRREFETDLMGTVQLVDAAMPYLEASKAASIVTISSVSAREIDFAAGPYGTFKAAIVHYTQGLANQLACKGIRANTVSPGNTGCGSTSATPTPSCTPRRWRSTRPGAWARPRKWPARWCSSPARRPALSAAPTWWSTAR